jgi:hypothetical protein
MDGERVNARFELGRERVVDHSMTGEPGLPSERISHDIYPEMGLPAGTMAGVALVLMGFIEHLQARGREGRVELGRYRLLHTRHDTHVMTPMRSINGGFTTASTSKVDAGAKHVR